MKKLTIIAVFFLALQMYGQQDPQYTQYMYNMNIMNPAYAGSRENLSFGLLYRNQWSKIDGGPETGTFFGHAPIGSNLGLGVSLIADQIGPVKETNAYVDLSYTLKLGGEHRLAFGVKAGATFHDINLTSGNVDVIDEGDPFFGMQINETTPNIGAGFFYYTNKYYVSLSVPNMLSSVHLDLKCSYLSRTSQYRNPDFFPNIVFTSSCNLNTQCENVSRLFIFAAVKGSALKFFVKLFLQYRQGKT